MWNLYYNPLGDIVHLSQQTLDTDLTVLQISDEMALDFIHGKLRYFDYVVNGSELIKKQDERDALWTVKQFVSESQGNCDIDFWIKGNELVYQTNCPIEVTKFWITEFGNPTRFIGTLIVPIDTRLLLPKDVKISIFAEKNLATFRLHENQPSRH